MLLAQESAQPVATQAVQAVQPRLHALQPERSEERTFPEQAIIAAISAMLTISKPKNPLFMCIASFAVNS